MLSELGAELQRARLHGFTDAEVQDARTMLIADAEETVRRETTRPAREVLRELNDDVTRQTPSLSAAQNLALLQRILPGITAREVSDAFAVNFDPSRSLVLAELPASDGAPSEPEHSTVTSRPSRPAHAAAALTLMSAATPMAHAVRAAKSVRVPLLVVRNTILPSRRAAPNSTGELPRSKPGIGSPPRSPAVRTPSPATAPARRRASAGSPTGTISRQPWANAVMMVVEARRTSITRAVTPSRSAGTTASAVGTTSIRTG